VQWALVEIQPQRRREPRDPFHLRQELRGVAAHDDPTPGALRAGRGTVDVESPRGEELASARREPCRSLLGDDAALAELAADRGDDGHRQVDRAREPARRDRLEPRNDGEHGADAALALDETDRRRNLVHDAVPFRQLHARAS
jgi:hypothetical protein